MSTRLSIATQKCEPATRQAVESLGLVVGPYGQELLTNDVRAMLRDVDAPERWTPDFLVTRPSIVGPAEWPASKWPPGLRDKYTFMIDAKWAPPDTGNHSVEMRSILAAGSFGLDVYYVCLEYDGQAFNGFGIIHYAQVLHGVLNGSYGSCCSTCRQIMVASSDAMRGLPKYCPGQERNSKSSGTPFVFFPSSALEPLNWWAFDVSRPDVGQVIRDAISTLCVRCQHRPADARLSGPYTDCCRRCAYTNPADDPLGGRNA